MNKKRNWTSTVIFPITTLEAECLVKELQIQIEEARDHGRMLVRLPIHESSDGVTHVGFLEIKPTKEEYNKMIGKNCKEAT